VVRLGDVEHADHGEGEEDAEGEDEDVLGDEGQDQAEERADNHENEDAVAPRERLGARVHPLAHGFPPDFDG
jgi:hypothetical protein